MDIIRESITGLILRQIAPACLPYPDEDLTALQESGKLKELARCEQDETVICDWNGEDDRSNPLKWRGSKKTLVLLTIVYYSLVVYMSAPIWTPSEEMFIKEYGTNYEYTTLGLALYVLGYGVGPLLFAPLSEIPSIGSEHLYLWVLYSRVGEVLMMLTGNPPYILTFVLFMLVTIPTALVHNAPAFMFLRFLQGFFGSPVLGAGGASIADVYNDVYRPVGLTLWSLACFVSPVIGPIIAGAAITTLGWRLSIWETLIASGPVIVLLLVMPETNPETILYYRARRLRKTTGNDSIRSRSEMAQAQMSFKKTISESLLVPAKVTLQDPAVLFTNIYLIFIYGIYYSFFEAFPLVYEDMYGFNILELGLAYIPIAVGTFFGFGGYFAWLWFYRRPKVLAGVQFEPEHILVPAMVGCLLPPVGLFLFGWLARPDIHWIAPMIGVSLYPAGVFIVFQNLLVYMANCYPKFAASLFAATDFTRSAFAVGAILAGRPLYTTLGIGGGCSLLAGLMILCIFGMFALYHYGSTLRARSKFAAGP